MLFSYSDILLMAHRSVRPAAWKWLMPPPSQFVDLDCWGRFGDLFSLWTIPDDLQLQCLDWLHVAPNLLWVWLLVKAPIARLAFSESCKIQATASVQEMCLEALDAAVRVWDHLPEDSWMHVESVQTASARRFEQVMKQRFLNHQISIQSCPRNSVSLFVLSGNSLEVWMHRQRSPRADKNI